MKKKKAQKCPLYYGERCGSARIPNCTDGGWRKCRYIVFQKAHELDDKNERQCKGCSGGSGSFCGDCRIKAYHTTMHTLAPTIRIIKVRRKPVTGIVWVYSIGSTL